MHFTTARDFVRRHLVEIGFLALIVACLGNLYLQYVSLAQVEKTSPTARRAWLHERLAKVAADVEEPFQRDARRALRVSESTIISSSNDDDVRAAFANAPKEGVQKYFISSIGGPKRAMKITVYDPRTGSLDETWSAEMFAMVSAAFPWVNLIRRDATVDPEALAVSEDDPEFHIVTKPITNASSQIVGVAGFVADEAYFRDHYVPAAVDSAIKANFVPAELDDFLISLHDDRDAIVSSTKPSAQLSAQPSAQPQASGPGKAGDDGDDASVALPFIFAKWRLAIRSQGMPYEQVARHYFHTNLLLSVAITLVLFVGVLLTMRTAAREMKLSQMKSDFVSNVSHELRTPLSSIRVFAELFRLGQVTDPELVRQFGTHMEAESRRLTQLINNILDYAKIESGRKTYDVAPTSVADVAASAVEAFDVSAKRQGFTVTLEPPIAPLPPAMIVAEDVGQALVNLLDNAVKYSGLSREISVRLGRDGDFVLVSVTDGGIGIPREEHERIFERFYRVSTGLVHDVKGTGLGLSLVKHIVEAQGGAVGVTSEPGRGSTFTIRLPIAGAEDTTPRTAAAGQETQLWNES